MLTSAYVHSVSWSTISSSFTSFGGGSSSGLSTSPSSPDRSRASFDGPRRPHHVPVSPVSAYANPLRSPVASFDQPEAESALARSTGQLHRDLDGRRTSRPGDIKAKNDQWFAIRQGLRCAPAVEGRPTYSAAYSRESQDLCALRTLAPTRLISKRSWALQQVIAQEAIGGISASHSRLVRADDGPIATRKQRASLSSKPIPKRVLDVGCGLAAPWIIAAAQEPGWEPTEFTGAREPLLVSGLPKETVHTGLDLAPTTVDPAWLPSNMAARISFVQYDLHKKPWPFPDANFDMVRWSFLGDAMPESLWADLVEEATRVTAPDGIVEVRTSSLS
jgi:SAM-dependent methyltransferase